MLAGVYTLSKTLFWFTNDLRLADNPALCQALARQTELSFVYCIDPGLFNAGRYHCRSLGSRRYRFIVEALEDLDARLQSRGQCLNVYYQNPLQVLARLCREHAVDKVFYSVQAGYNENMIIGELRERLPNTDFVGIHTHTLFSQGDLPFPLGELPATFSQFRRQLESRGNSVATPLPAPEFLGNPFIKSGIESRDWRARIPGPSASGETLFNGGETRGLRHLTEYFQHGYAQTYKATRNALDDPTASTRFSPWLAQGCISPRRVVSHLRRHEQDQGANESTYWIYFELLWREYFQWYAHCHGRKLFRFQGLREHKPLTSFYPERFRQWCEGSTRFPVVNACMKQLNATGYMSNRGRQLVASCLVNELELDWRYGAAYFEEQLVDYDVASNWGNWQYLAGVGADPRGSRQFNLDKQTQTHDPEGDFIRRWGGAETCLEADSMDAVGWPLAPALNDRA